MDGARFCERSSAQPWRHAMRARTPVHCPLAGLPPICTATIMWSDDMGMLRFRLTGPEAGLASMMSMIEGIDHVDRVEEVGDLMSGMRDDSSSAELSDDMGSRAAHDVEVHASSADAVGDVHAAIERAAGELGVAVEFVDDF